APLLEHLLDQVDAPARAVPLVPQQHVGRTGGGAQPAMHALAEDLVHLRGARIFELAGGEVGLHGAPIAHQVVVCPSLGAAVDAAVTFAHRHTTGSDADDRPPAADVPSIKARLLLHYAQNDDRIDAGIPAYREALDKAGVKY